MLQPAFFAHSSVLLFLLTTTTCSNFDTSKASQQTAIGIKHKTKSPVAARLPFLNSIAP